MPTDIRVRMVAHDFGRGGAGRAATRIADALTEDAETLGVRLDLRSVDGPTHPLGGVAPYPGGAARLRRYASSLRRRAADRLPWAPATTELHSRADVWTGLGRELNGCDADVISLHWLGTGTLSIEEIGRLTRPVVITLHDMWAFSGAEHISYDERYVTGYARGTRPAGEAGVDWNRRTWRRKRRSWRRPMYVVTPSRWLAGCVRRSALMQDWPVTVIPNPLDAEFWRPVDRDTAREQLGLPQDRTLLLFGADGGTARFTKGGDLLEETLRRLSSTGGTGAVDPIELVIFGGPRAHLEPAGRLPYPTHHLGPITEDLVLRNAYGACDVMVVPSRIDNLPNTATEAQACGLPVVAFRTAGLPDIVTDGRTGRLARPFDVHDLAEAIRWTVTDEDRRRKLGREARDSAKARFSPRRVAEAYAAIYRDAVEAGRQESVAPSDRGAVRREQDR